MKTKRQRKEAAPPLPEALKELPVCIVTSAEMLEQACREPFTSEFEWLGKKWQLQGRRLTPAQLTQVNNLLEQALPDLLPGDPLPNGQLGEPKYNLRDPKYLEKKAKYKAQSRALALYLGYEVIKWHVLNIKVEPGKEEQARELCKVAKMPEITKITDTIESMWTDQIHSHLITDLIGDNRLWQRVNLF